MMIQKKNKNCPICNKSDMVIKIVYGEPTEETWNNAEKGKVYIGGCLQCIPVAKWYCKRDKKIF